MENLFLEHVSFSYDKIPAVSDISLEIKIGFMLKRLFTYSNCKFGRKYFCASCLMYGHALSGLLGQILQLNKRREEQRPWLIFWHGNVAVDSKDVKWGVNVTLVKLWNPVFPKGIMEKNGPSITVSPKCLRALFTLQRIISHISYFIRNGSKPTIRCISLTPA